MLRDKIKNVIIEAVVSAYPDKFGHLELDKIVKVERTESSFGDYSTNIALILLRYAVSRLEAHVRGIKITGLPVDPFDLAQTISEKMDKSLFESVEAVAPGFINFRLKTDLLLQPVTYNLQPKTKGKILLEYFQPNIAKPLHVGHLRTAIIGDSIKRMLLFLGQDVESDTHMGDWGTQFGILIFAYKKYGDHGVIEKDPINELNKLYIQINQEIITDSGLHEQAKKEFVKLEQGDEENRKIWKQFVDWSVEKFLKINDLMDILPFDHHWPESFYEDKMPEVLKALKNKKILHKSQGAQIVDLEKQGLGVAVIIKSDGGTTYLLRDLATYIFVKEQGFAKHLYVVDNRQALHYRQLFAILKLLKHMKSDDEAKHINYGFISFKGDALSTRKGNMILVEDVLDIAEEKVAKIIEEKNPDLKNKEQVIKAVTKGALKYFDLKHNRHSDIEFSWDEVLDFEGDSGPYLQYAYARLSSILRKAGNPKSEILNPKQISPTEREILFKSSILDEVVSDSLKDYLPNVLANYLYNLATLLNKFYHESPVIAEKDEQVKNFRLGLIAKAKDTLGKGLDLLGIQALEEM